MTVKLLCDWTDSRNGKNYKVGNLLTTDAGTESGLVAAKIAETNLTGGTAYVAPVAERQRFPVFCEVDQVTGVIRKSDGTASAAKTLLNDTTVLGDSTMSYGGSATIGLTSQGQVVWANDILCQSGEGFNVTSWRAVSGVTVAQVIANQLPGTLTDATEIAWLKAGINNFDNAILIATTLADWTTLISALADVKKLVIVDSMQPLFQSGSTTAKARAYQLPSMNAALQEICNRFSNVFFNDVYSDLVDPASDSLNPISGTMRTDDGVHQTSYGARFAGHGSAKRLLAAGYVFTSNKVKSANILTGFSGTGGSTFPNGASVTGTPPAGYNLVVTGGGAGTAVTVSSVGPDMIRLAITNSFAANVRVRLNKTGGALLTACAGGAGTSVSASVGIQVSGIAGLLQVCPQLAITGPGAITWSGGIASTNEPTISYGTKAFGGRRAAPVLTLTGTPTGVTFNLVDVIVAASTGAATVDVYLPEFVTLI